MIKLRSILYTFTLLITNVACSSRYITPGASADLSIFTNPQVKESFIAKPAVKFPAHVVSVRIQEPGYKNYSLGGYGEGKYSVVTVREVEKHEDIEKLSKLPGVAQVGTLNRLLLPMQLTSDLALREGAARLQADLLFIYTFATSFHDNDLIPPLTVITLGFSPTRTYKASSVASAVLMDVKTGFVYSALEESSETFSGVTIAWNSSEAMENARKEAERQAFERLMNSFEVAWATTYERYRK